MRPYVKRALGTTIVAIETEASAPYRIALRTADALLAELAARDAAATWDVSMRADLVARADAAHRTVARLLEPDPEESA
jgi:hypothetical protein